MNLLPQRSQTLQVRDDAHNLWCQLIHAKVTCNGICKEKINDILYDTVRMTTMAWHTDQKFHCTFHTEYPKWSWINGQWCFES